MPIRPALLAVATGALMTIATLAPAEIRVRFEEAAPKDRFEIWNRSGCGLGQVTVEIDLGGSAAGLIFDTTGAGAGVSVYQPFELVEGQVARVTQVTDGDSRIVLELPALPPGGRVSFTIDVDDTVASGPLGPTMVDGSEIAGARASASQGGTPVVATFGPNAYATIPLEACVS